MPSDEPLAVQDEHFVDCILSGKIPQSDGSVGLSVVRVLEAAQRSIDCGGPVRLDESGTAPTRAAALASALRGRTA
jgi:predicted dehydrogenase